MRPEQALEHMHETSNLFIHGHVARRKRRSIAKKVCRIQHSPPQFQVFTGLVDNNAGWLVDHSPFRTTMCRIQMLAIRV